MKALFSVLLFSVGAPAAEIPQGTHVLLRMMNSLTTRTAKEGDQVYLQTANPIALDGRIVVPPGSYVQGTVAMARRSGKVSGRAELALRLETLTLANGSTLKFSPHLASVDDAGESGQKVNSEGVVKQASTKGKDLERIAILAGAGAALGASVGAITDGIGKGVGIGAGAGGAVGIATTLLTRGREVELRMGSTLDVVFDRAMTIE